MAEFKAVGRPFAGRSYGAAQLYPSYRTKAFDAQVEGHVILDAMEQELDSLLQVLESDARGKAVAESIIRRYTTIEELHQELTDSMRRVDLKLMMVSQQVTGGFGGRQVLETTGETDQETA